MFCLTLEQVFSAFAMVSLTHYRILLGLLAGLSLGAVSQLEMRPAIAQADDGDINPPYSTEELEPLETEINSEVEGESDQTEIPGPFDDFNLYSEDEYDLYEGIDAYEIYEFPEEPDVYDEQPGVTSNEEN
ncbi:hypothetical protein C7271_08530 [filamentous cyanobacterium CCP5]|nr:hypothetical protein C7271_08530 [filamentous cyanobacterium CCP5]